MKFIKNIKNIGLNFSSYILRMKISYRPLFVVIEPTYSCNLRCKTCNIHKTGKSDVNEKLLTVSEYKRFFEELKIIGTQNVIICGGEPFVRRDTPDIIRAAKNCDLHIHVITNGTCLTDKIINNLFNMKLDMITFSLESSIPKIHEKIRGVKGCFSKTTDSIEKIIRGRNERKVNYPKIIINSVISKYNYNDIHNIPNLLPDVDLFNFIFPTEISENSLEETNKIFNKRIYSGQFYNLNIKYKKHENILRKKLSMTNKEKINIKTSFLSKNSFERCLYLWFASNMSPIGNIYPCTVMDKLKMGNIKNNSFIEIWNSQEYRNLRKIFLSKHLKICKECTCGISIKSMFTQFSLLL